MFHGKFEEIISPFTLTYLRTAFDLTLTTHFFQKGSININKKTALTN